jgi:transposase
MTLALGIDIAKEQHWVTALDRQHELLLDARLDNTPEAIALLVDRLRQLEREHGPASVGIDVVGGIASLVTAMLQDAGLGVVHVPGLAVNRAREATRGGESKSDPRDARVIAQQVLQRRDLRALDPAHELDVELRLLVGRRRDLVDDQTRRIGRLRDLLASLHPGLERVVAPTTKTGAWLLTRSVTPAEIRRAGRRRLLEHLARAGQLPRAGCEQLTDRALASAHAQQVAVPGERLAAELVRELAGEILAARTRLATLDHDLADALARHPDAALIQTLPGMGATLTAEFLAEAGGIARFPRPDQLAAAAGLAPVRTQSGTVDYRRRSLRGNRTLKRVCYQSAFCSLNSPASRQFYARKRREGKRHHQAVIALARRRIDVLHAMHRTRQPYRDPAHRSACLTH